MRSDRRLELKIGVFLGLGIILMLVVIWALGSTQDIFGRSDLFFVRLHRVDGITIGAKVTISGVSAGSVESFSLDSRSEDVRVNLRISKKLEGSLRRNSFVEVLSEGVLGDKQIAISSGSPSSPELAPGSEIEARAEVSLGSVIGKGDQLLANLSVLAHDLDRLTLRLDGQMTGGHLSRLIRDLDQAVLSANDQLKGNHLSNSLQELDSVLGKIDHGNGTLGGLVNDPELYDDVKSLIGESNRNRIVRNLVRKTIEDGQKTHG